MENNFDVSEIGSAQPCVQLVVLRPPRSKSRINLTSALIHEEDRCMQGITPRERNTGQYSEPTRSEKGGDGKEWQKEEATWPEKQATRLPMGN